MSTQAPKFFSVTFQVLDEAKFQTLASKFLSEMADGAKSVHQDPPYVSNDALRGYSVTACGWCDFATQAAVYGEALEADADNPSLKCLIDDWVCENYPDHTREEVEALVKGIIG